MRLNKPNPSRTVRVTATDVDSGKSKTKTFYDTTPEAVIDRLASTAEDADEGQAKAGVGHTSEATGHTASSTT